MKSINAAIVRTAIAGVSAVGLSAAAQAGSFGKPCTTVPQAQWLSLQEIEKIVTDHGYTIAKSKVKDTCVEIYARDNQGTRVELFIDPSTGTPVGADGKF